MRLRVATAAAGEPWEASLVLACQQGAAPAEVVQRCYDLGDLLAVAAGGRAQVAFVAEGLRWLDREAVARLAAAGVAVVGVVPAGDEAAEIRVRQLGVTRVVGAQDPPDQMIATAASTVVEPPQPDRLAPRRPRPPRVLPPANPTGPGREQPPADPGATPAAQGAAPGEAPQPEAGEEPATGRPAWPAAGESPDPGTRAGSPGPWPQEAEPPDAPQPGEGGDPPARAGDPWAHERQTPVGGGGSGWPGGGPADAGQALVAGGRSSWPDGGSAGGQVIAVWGPKGAPGRTTVALNLAFEAAPLIGETLLVDADTYGGSVAQALGFLDDYPGLAGVARMANRGDFDVPRLWQAARRAAVDGPRVLTGLPRAELWTEVRPATWEHLLGLFREAFALTVLDVGFCVEEDEELLYDQVRLRRNAVARIAIEQADLVVAVVRADPIGLHDFIRAYQPLADMGVGADRVRLVVNQLRGGLFGGDGPEQIRAALTRYLGLEPVAFIPDDRPALDAALLAARALIEARPASPAREAIAGLARTLLGVPGAPARPGRLRRPSLPGWLGGSPRAWMEA